MSERVEVEDAGDRHTCNVCGEPIEQPRGQGRRRKTCSAACRQRSYMLRTYVRRAGADEEQPAPVPRPVVEPDPPAADPVVLPLPLPQAPPPRRPAKKPAGQELLRRMSWGVLWDDEEGTSATEARPGG
ncbi:hypothetical protein [Streptomyces hydrogenans]|uniref:hypothetical protein n=1 Tax=Streptomyces hydrogenans TaxID=1873719 RepID=UPI0033F9E428